MPGLLLAASQHPIPGASAAWAKTRLAESFSQFFSAYSELRSIELHHYCLQTYSKAVFDYVFSGKYATRTKWPYGHRFYSKPVTFTKGEQAL